MLMGPKKKSPFDRRWVLALVMAAVLAAGLGVGLHLGRTQTARPAAPSFEPPTFAAQAPAPAAIDRPSRRDLPPAEIEEDDRPALAPPPGRPDGVATPATPAPVEVAASVPLILPQPSVKPTAPGAPAWVRYAVPAPKPAGQAMIAVIIDDLGVDRKRSERVTLLRAPLTLAYMTYAEDLPRQTGAARARGHELMLHVPMQPMDSTYDAGPDVLEVTLSPTELRRRLVWGLDRFEGFVAVNNHMGSRFTADRPGMRVVMEELSKRGLAFVDSVTSDKTVGSELARNFGVPFAARHVFLDNEMDLTSIKAQLAKAEAYAKKHGAVIAIGHPHDATIEALAAWLPGLDARGIVLVPVTAIIRNRPNG